MSLQAGVVCSCVYVHVSVTASTCLQNNIISYNGQIYSYVQALCTSPFVYKCPLAPRTAISMCLGLVITLLGAPFSCLYSQTATLTMSMPCQARSIVNGIKSS